MLEDDSNIKRVPQQPWNRFEGECNTSLYTSNSGCFSILCVLMLLAFNLTSPWTWCANLIPGWVHFSLSLLHSALRRLLDTAEQMESVLWPRYVRLKPRLWNGWHALDMIASGNKTALQQKETRRTGCWINTSMNKWSTNRLGSIRAHRRNEGSLRPTRLFRNCRGSSPPSTLFLGVRAEEGGRQTVHHLVIRGEITISFVWELFREQRGRTKQAITALCVPLLSFSFNRVGSLPVFEPPAGPQLAECHPSSSTH